MNFLGHLYFSGKNTDLMHANLFGDFVKGRDLSHFPQILEQGFKLHRTIDNFIDTHPVVVKLNQTFYDELPKISGVAMDLFFDHLLAKNWDDYHPVSLREFVDIFYKSQIHPTLFPYFTDVYLIMLERMKKYDWLFNYSEFNGLKRSCEQLSTRINFENNLYNAPSVYLRNENKIEDIFRIYMDDAIPFFRNYSEKFLSEFS